MAAEFEMEVRNSIAALSATIDKMAAAAEKSNAALRTMQQEAGKAATSVKQVAASHEQIRPVVENNDRALQGFGKAAKGAGGALGNMVKEGLELVRFNPVVLAAGAGLGLLVTQGAALVEQWKEAKKAVQDYNASVASAQSVVDATGKKALAGLNPQEVRRREFGDIAPEDERTKRILDSAVATGQVTREEARQNLDKSGLMGRGRDATSEDIALRLTGPTSDQAAIQAAAGLENMDPEEFADRLRRASGSRAAIIADAAARTQAQTAADDIKRTMTEAGAGAGLSTNLADRQALALAGPEQQAVLKAMLAELQRLRESYEKGRGGGLDIMGNQQDRGDAVMRQEAAILTYESSLGAATR